VIDKGSHLEGLRADHVAIPDAPGDDEAAHMIFPNPPGKSPIFGIIRRRIVSIAAHYDQLRDAIV
jgi:hypothetical protein